MASKKKEKYRIYFGQDICIETLAVSSAQAINNAKYQLGLAESYEYHEYVVSKIEIFNTDFNQYVELIECDDIKLIEQNERLRDLAYSFKNDKEYYKEQSEFAKHEIIDILYHLCDKIDNIEKKINEKESEEN